MTDFLRRLPAPTSSHSQISSSSTDSTGASSHGREDLTVADASLGSYALTSSIASLYSSRERRAHLKEDSNESFSGRKGAATAAGGGRGGGSSAGDKMEIVRTGALYGRGNAGAVAALASSVSQERQMMNSRGLGLGDGRGRREGGPPPYGRRQGFIPRTEEDFGGGGAFPEIPVAQYPLGLGKKKTGMPSTVALQLGADGKLAYDVIIKQNSDKKMIYSTPEAAEGIDDNKVVVSTSSGIQVVKRVGNAMPSVEEEQKELERTKAALQAALEKKLGASQVKKACDRGAVEFYRYTPAQQDAGHNSGCAQRVLRVEDMQIDPLNPPKFRHKRVPAAGSGSPPPPVLHSPTRKLTQQDQAEWKIPPSISNWKNQKGYTIPLDKRLQADGRNLQDVSINDKFASLSEALYIAERQAREEIRLRNEIKKQKKIREEEMREQQLRLLAAQARAERSNILQQQQQKKAAGGDGANVNPEEEEEKRKRDALVRERQREIEREMRLERNKRGRNDEDRDVSERVALGLPPTKKAGGGDAVFDTRLFNQSAGVDSGFDGGNDDAYNLYDKPLFSARENTAAIYHFSRERLLNAVGNTSEVPSFAGADRSTYTRTAPVEFEKDISDPFGLDNLLSEAKKQ
ncbi:skip snw domain-containing protein [Cystoisospora suis]|uniref:Skip snw domain-containing protein n=1 Tax=Cystoisospora suis TaxID=483139 RepID=A0A2C6KZB8_9APIC|nr:skip snw domain-containing protein [Cystoisospora suis]